MPHPVVIAERYAASHWATQWLGTRKANMLAITMTVSTNVDLCAVREDAFGEAQKGDLVVNVREEPLLRAVQEGVVAAVAPFRLHTLHLDLRPATPDPHAALDPPPPRWADLATLIAVAAADHDDLWSSLGRLHAEVNVGGGTAEDAGASLRIRLSGGQDTAGVDLRDRLDERAAPLAAWAATARPWLAPFTALTLGVSLDRPTGHERMAAAAVAAALPPTTLQAHPDGPWLRFTLPGGAPEPISLNLFPRDARGSRP